jgi:CheY-like chemotaxis protein
MQGSKRGGRVLVTEDNPLHMKIFKLNLTVWSILVYEATNGEDGLRLAHVEHPDLILADIGLPRLDGCGMIRALRADPQTADIPIMVVSARPQSDPDVQSILPLVEAFIPKPFDPEQLARQVAERLRLA